MPKSDMTIAGWSINYAYPVLGRKEWIDLLRSRLEEAAKAGCRLMVLPEYTSDHWLHWRKTKKSSPATTMKWIAEEGAVLLDSIAALSRETGIGIVAGSMPHDDGAGRYFNRAWILLPDEKGKIRRLHHDKLVQTPVERENGAWPIRRGRSLTLVEWQGIKIAILICLDVEMPSFIAALQDEEIDLLVIPSMTSGLSGYRRVFDCAKAAAIALFSTVLVVGGIGSLAPGMEGNCAGAAFYIPCEKKLGSKGVLKSIGPLKSTRGKGPLTIARIPVSKIRALREAGPEAWPGPITATSLGAVKRWKVAFA